ncbi:Fc.00g085860.m01.CDS01 [Cosmosporella sp. VM-42]
MESKIEEGRRHNQDLGQHNESLTSSNEFREPTLPPWQFWLLSVGISLGLFLSMIDTTIVATCLYSIGQDFATLENDNWVALSYTLTYLGFSVIFPRISDVIGRRNAFVAAYLIFFAFSLGCGFAQTLNQLIIFRAFQGVGGSGLYSLTMIMLPELCPPHLRPRIGALVGMVVAMSGILGPLLGGIFSRHATWRWAFWINGPIGGASMAIFFLTWPKAKYLATIERRSWKELDYLGSFLGISAATLVVFAFQNAGAHRLWSGAIFIAPLVAGLVGWASLVGWQFFIRTHLPRLAAAFPLSLFHNRVYTTACLNTLLLGFPYMLLVYSVPLRIQWVGHKSSLVAGLMMLPMVGTVAIGSMVAGKVNSVKNYIFETLFIGSCLMLLGCGLLSTLNNTPDAAKLLGFLAFTGLGFGLTIAASTMLSSIEAPIRDFAPAQGILSQLRMLGGSLGIASSTAFLYLSAEKHAAIPYLLDPGRHLTKAQWYAVDLAFTESFRAQMVTSTAIAAVAVIVTFGAFQRRRLLIDEQRTMRVDEETQRRREVFTSQRDKSSSN